MHILIGSAWCRAASCGDDFKYSLQICSRFNVWLTGGGHMTNTERRWRWTLCGSNCNSLFILYLEFVSGQFWCESTCWGSQMFWGLVDGCCWVSSSPQSKEQEHCFLLKQRIKVRVSKMSRLMSVMCHRLFSQRPEVSTCWNRKWFSGLTRRVDGLISELIGP